VTGIVTGIGAFIRRHPVPAYFVLTFAISWGGVLLVIGGPGGIPGTMAQADPLFRFVFLAMLAGPSVAGVLLTGVVHGRTGLRDLRSRLVGSRLGVGWYAAALLTAPLLATETLLALSPLVPELVPGILATDDKFAVLLLGFAVGLAAGVFEDLGWTGFAVPEIRRRHGVLVTGLLVGLLWAAWHILVVVWGIGDRSGTMPLALFVALDTASFLPAFRVLMVWVYDRTQSLLLGMLMHASLTATTLTLWPRTAGLSLPIFDLTFAAAVWAIFAVIVVTSRRGRLDGWPRAGQPEDLRDTHPGVFLPR
jgi:membrane protease YdiL (CAAX protease family)